MRSNGRPTKFDPKIAERIVLLVRNGNFRETAAASVGVDSKTLRNWLKRGAKGGKANGEFAEFASEVFMGEAEANIRDFAKIGSSDDWKAHQYRCAVRDRETYGVRNRVDIEVDQVTRKLLTIAERVLPSVLYDKLIDAIASSEGGPAEEGGESS